MNKETFENVCKRMIEMHERKNKDYGNSFAKVMNEFEPFGTISAATQIAHKANRIISLAKQEARGDNPNYEGLNDSLIDAACYCIMTYVERVNKIDNAAGYIINED